MGTHLDEGSEKALERFSKGPGNVLKIHGTLARKGHGSANGAYPPSLLHKFEGLRPAADPVIKKQTRMDLRLVFGFSGKSEVTGDLGRFF